MRWLLIASLSSVLLIHGPKSSAEDKLAIEGRWEGVEAKDGEELPMALEISRRGKLLAGTFSFSKNGILDAPMRKVRFEQGRFEAQFGPPSQPSAIGATLSGNDLKGTIAAGKLEFEMRLTRARPLERPYSIERFRFSSGDGQLSGSLYRPTAAGKHPAVVIVPGSGDTPHVAHPMMADFFARLGCVCLVYDKRGVGESGGAWRDVGFWELADDANAAARALSEREDVEPKRIGLFGYSQAGWIIPMAASRNADLAFLIVVSGGPVTVEREGYWDVEYLLRKNGYADADVEEALSYYRLSNRVTRTGEGYDEMVDKLNEIRPRPWFKLLGIFVPAPVNHVSRQWYRRVMDIDHVPIVSALRLPVLWIYGDDDGDFPALDAAKIVQSIQANEKSDFTVRIIPGAGHAIHVPAPAGAKMRFGRPAAEYPALIGDWMRSKKLLE